jgi:hypothetical protein
LRLIPITALTLFITVSLLTACDFNIATFRGLQGRCLARAASNAAHLNRIALFFSRGDAQLNET